MYTVENLTYQTPRLSSSPAFQIEASPPRNNKLSLRWRQSHCIQVPPDSEVPKSTDQKAQLCNPLSFELLHYIPCYTAVDCQIHRIQVPISLRSLIHRTLFASVSNGIPCLSTSTPLIISHQVCRQTPRIMPYALGPYVL